MRKVRPIGFALFALALAIPSVAHAQSARYVEKEVMGGGVIRGKVAFKGEAPRLTLSVTADRKDCTHEGGKVASPRLKVSPEGGVAETVVFLRSIAEGKPLSELPGAFTLDQVGCVYEPFVQVVAFKERLAIFNSDSLIHNVNAKLDGGKQIFNYAMPNPEYPKKKKVESRRLVRPGVLHINCNVHTWMSAYVWVVRHPYYAVTDSTGAFELTDVPPGDYELTAWHPGWNAKPKTSAQGGITGYDYGEFIEKTANVTVAANGETTVTFVINE